MYETNLTRVRRILRTDPIWAAYALADLQPHLAGDCRWLTAAATQGEALALLYYGLLPPVLLTVGDACALAALLETAAFARGLPGKIYASIREEHLPAVGGTHVVDYEQGLAAIGNMYTAPDYRRRAGAGRTRRQSNCA